MILLFIIITLSRVNTFQTTINSLYTLSDPPAIQSGTVSIVTTSNRMLSTDLNITYIFVFERPFLGTSVGFATFLDWEHYSTVNAINLNLFVDTCTKTNIPLIFNDKVSPDNVKKITLRVFAHDNILVPNIHSQVFELESNWVNQTSINTGLDTSKPMFLSCHLLTFVSSQPTASVFKAWIDCWMLTPPTMKLYTQNSYTTLDGSKRKFRILVICMNQEYPIDLQNGGLSSTSDRIIMSVSSQHHLILGLCSFEATINPISFNMDSSYLGIIQPAISSSSKTWYKYITVKDIRTPTPVPPTPIYQVELTTVKSYSLSNNTLQLIYENLPFSLTSVTLPQVRINDSKITIINLTVSNNMMIILCEYSENIEGLPIQVEFDWSIDNWNSTATSLLTLQGTPPLKVYSDSDRKKPRLILILCQIMQYLYLATFAICLLSNKLVGIQVMSLIQLTFYCLIPANISNPVFTGLSQIRYVNGYNFKFEGLKQKSLFSVLSTMAFKSNFLSNVNFMLCFVALCPLMFGVLLLASKHSKSYKHKPRTKKYAMAAICEWSFTLLFFSCYNIFASMVLNIQSLGTQDPLSLFMSIFISLLPIIALIVYFFFRSHFKEFATEINQNSTIWNFSLDFSTFLSNMYPCVLGVEMILVPSFLASESLMNCSLYIVLGIILMTTSCMVAVMPYNIPINNIRLFVNQILKVGMLIGFILCKEKINTDTEISDPFVNLVVMILGILGVGILVNFPFVIWRTVCWIKQNGIIDMKMYLDHIGKTSKKSATLQTQNAMLYPILEYGIGRQALLDKENEKRRLNIANVRMKNQEESELFRVNKEMVQKQMRAEMIQ